MLFTKCASRSLSRRTALALTGGGIGAILLAACGTDSSSGTGTASDGGAAAGGRGPKVITSVYPVAYLVQKIGGDAVDSVDFAKPGADPHALELSIVEVAEVDGADLVITIPGFQAAMDDAVAARVSGAELSVYEAFTPLAVGEDGHTHDGHDHAQDDHAQDDHAHEEHAHDAQHDESAASDAGGSDHHGHDHHGHDHGPHDPHFWHDPLRMADLADAIAARLSDISPEHAQTYAANAESVRADLEALHAELTEQFNAVSGDRTFITSHAAFAYLADRYGLHQIGIAGIEPESEPSPQRLLELEQVVAEEGVNTIFFESTAAPAVAETLARNVGLEAQELDNLETQLSADIDYIDSMRANADKLLASWA